MNILLLIVALASSCFATVFTSIHLGHNPLTDPNLQLNVGIGIVFENTLTSAIVAEVETHFPLTERKPLRIGWTIPVGWYYRWVGVLISGDVNLQKNYGFSSGMGLIYGSNSLIRLRALYDFKNNHPCGYLGITGVW